MYYHFSTAVKRKIIDELRLFWSEHPKYRDLLAKSIRGKYAYGEQEQASITVMSASGNIVSLSPDSYIGMKKSHVHLARVGNYPGLSIEWVREDSMAIRNNGGTFPSLPGVYYVTLLQDNSFTVRPMLDVFNEQVVQVSGTTYQLGHTPVPGTVRLYDMPGNIEFVEGKNYTIGADGQITLLTSATSYLSADYRYEEPVQGPYTIRENYADNEAIPGVVLLFGRRCQAGDQMGIVVTSERQLVAMEYGGRWSFSVEIEVRARDDINQGEITDATAFYLWAIARPRLSSQGVEISSVSIGGESEEPYDDVADDYWYVGSISVEMEVDWSFNVPLSACIRRISPQTLANFEDTSDLTGEELVAAEQNLLVATSALGLRSFEDPFFALNKATFERIV